MDCDEYPDPIPVDVRFAGGTVFVERGELPGVESVIDLVIPGASRLPVFPHEARELAAALLKSAATKNETAPGSNGDGLQAPMKGTDA